MKMRREYRALVFWGVCIPTRLLIARHAGADTMALRAIAALIGSRWLLGMENGQEGVFGGPVWWARQRPLHGTLWSLYSLTGDNAFLYLDTTAGAANWLLKF
mgnify:CR=1 FL=1